MITCPAILTSSLSDYDDYLCLNHRGQGVCIHSVWPMSIRLGLYTFTMVVSETTSNIKILSSQLLWIALTYLISCFTLGATSALMPNKLVNYLYLILL